MKMIHLIIGSCLLIAGTHTLRAEGYAVVVGVNECPRFRLPDGSRPRPLKGAETDADAMAQMLIQRVGLAKRNVHILKGSQATHGKLSALLDRMSRELQRDDVFVFHFSGHGTQIPERKPPFDEPDNVDEAICLYDAKSNGDNLLLDDELGIRLEKIPARSVTVLLDCCHAGTGIKDPNVGTTIPRYLPIKIGKPSLGRPKRPWRELQGSSKAIDRRLCAFFACRADQQAYERRFLQKKTTLRAGQFSYYFLQGLKNNQADEDQDGIISQREALQFTTKRLDETFNRAKTLLSERQQPALESAAENQPLFWMGNAQPKTSEKQ